MKKKSTVFFVLLFACAMMFSFGLATTASSDTCCELNPQCPNPAIGHKHYQQCILDFTSPCDQIGEACRP